MESEVKTPDGQIADSEIVERHEPKFSPDDPQERFADLEDFFENGAVGLHMLAPDGTILRANRAELELLGYTAEEYVGHRADEFHIDQPTIDHILENLARGQTLRRFPARLRAKDGSTKHVLITSNGHFRDGRLVNTRWFMVDVTEARLAEQRRRQSEDVFRQILEALPAAVYTTDAGGVLTYCNQAAVDIAGREPEIGKERWCISWRLYHPDGSPLAKDQCPMAVALKEGRPVLGEEIVVERPDGSRVPLVPFPAPLHDESGRLVGGVNVLVDISERKESERKLELLVRELNHRVKNTLAIVQALAQQTSRSTKSLDEFVASFGGRIQAMARSHALLSSTYWNGAALEALIRDELQPGARRDGRITWSGPPVTLDPQVAVNVSLLIHELAANARRHGALSKARGALKVTWSLEGNSNELLRLEWSEMGIRRRRTSPARGFGSRLIERIVETYDGKARMELVDRGIAWIITLELPPGRTALEGKPSAPAETRARA